MTQPTRPARAQSLSIDLTELRVLCALCKLPDAPALEVARALTLSPSTVSQVKARLRRRGVWRASYVSPFAPEQIGPLLGFWGRTHGTLADGDFGRHLGRLLRDLKVASVVSWQDSYFVGVALPGSLAPALELESELLGLREEGSTRPVVDWFRMNAFTGDFPARSVLLEYGDFLEGLLPAHLRPRGAAAREAPRPRGASRAAPLGPTARKVAAEILANPHLGIEEGAKACGISVSTFAHTKSSLLRSGLIARRVRVDAAALGFRYSLTTVIEHRPAGARGRGPGWLEGALHSNAPVVFLGSSLCSFATAPYRTLEEAREAEREFRVWAAGQEPLVPPVALCFDRATVHTLGHAEPGKPAVAHVMGLGRNPTQAHVEV